MKLLFILIVVLGGGYMFPQIYEEVDGPCQALEKKIIRENVDKGLENSTVSNLALAISNGDIGERVAADEFPKLPPRIGCLAVYYNFPDDLRL